MNDFFATYIQSVSNKFFHKETSEDVSKIKLSKNDSVELLYSNGSVAFVYDGSQSPVVGSQTGTNHQAPVTSNQTSEKKSLTISQQQPEKTAPPTGPISNNINVATTTAPAREDQLANVIAVVDKKNFLEGKGIFLIMPRAIFAPAGLFFIRRYSGDIDNN